MARHWLIGLLVAGVCAGCATGSREPANLFPHKLEIRAYVDSGRYDRDIAAVAAQANAWVEARANRRTPAERLAVVFDLDETLFRNWPSMIANDFGYIPERWAAWVEAAQAPPIEPVREVFRTARRLGVAVVLITGRPERARGGTERNLRAIECGDYAALICRTDRAEGTAAAFKAAERRKLAAAGWVIIANIGDQESDLAGGFAERTFKLPNPFYLTQ